MAWKVRCVPGQTVELGSRLLDAGLPLEGRVLDGLDRPVRGARVTVQQKPAAESPWEGEVECEVRTDDGGGFRATALRPGPARVEVETDWTRRAVVLEVRVAADASPVALRLPAPGTLSCQVVDRAGTNVARGVVHITALHGGESERRHADYLPRTDLAGRFRIPVAAGTYRVQIRRSGAWNEEDRVLASETVVVPPGGEGRARLVIDRE